MNVFTIGYEGTTQECFIEVLKKNKIELLIDVRELPLSRKPGFSKRGLMASAEANGFDYMHFPHLGCPKPIRSDYRLDGDWGQYTVRFLEYLETQQEAMECLMQQVSTANCCLLCFEADANFCHRSYVAERLKLMMADVPALNIVHLTIPTQAVVRS